TARLKRSRLFLRHFVDVPKHLARSREVKTTLRPQLTQRGEHVVRAVDVRAHRRKAVSETFRHETLGREVIALVKIVLTENVEDAGVAFETGRVQSDSVQNMSNAAEPRLRGFEGHAADQPVYFITQTQQVIGEVTAILTRNSSNQRSLRHSILQNRSDRTYRTYTAERTLPKYLPACEAEGFCLKWPVFNSRLSSPRTSNLLVSASLLLFRRNL